MSAISPAVGRRTGLVIAWDDFDKGRIVVCGHCSIPDWCGISMPGLSVAARASSLPVTARAMSLSPGAWDEPAGEAAGGADDDG